MEKIIARIMLGLGAIGLVTFGVLIPEARQDIVVFVFGVLWGMLWVR